MKHNINFSGEVRPSKKIALTIPQFVIALLVCFLLSGAIQFAILQSVGTNSTQRTSSTARTSQSSTTLPPRLIAELEDSYAMIKRYYIGEVDEEKLIDGALAGFVGGLNDKYTSYMNASEMTALQQSTDGEFEGIGVEIEPFNDYIRIVSPIDNSPAFKGGLQTGDLITAVNGEDIQGKSTAEVAKKVRGKKGTPVTLTIQRSGSAFDITIIRDTIPVISVSGTMNGTVGVIRISSFAKNTYDELVETIKKLRAQGAKSFAIDVRSNPGGLLDSVEKIVNIFVENNQVMFKMQDRTNGVVEYKSSSKLGDFKVTEPLVVLTDKGSASAAEIFAAAMKELNRGIVIGQTTFGKGTAQTIQDLTNTTGLKVTYSKWLTPRGNWVHDKGLEPDIAISLPEYANYAYVNDQLLIQIGEQSDSVLNAQKILNVLGYQTALTGVYDDDMQAAVRRFNATNQIAGETLNAQTAQKMNQLLRDKVVTEDNVLKEALQRLSR